VKTKLFLKLNFKFLLLIDAILLLWLRATKVIQSDSALLFGRTKEWGSVFGHLTVKRLDYGVLRATHVKCTKTADCSRWILRPTAMCSFLFIQ